MIAEGDCQDTVCGFLNTSCVEVPLSHRHSTMKYCPITCTRNFLICRKWKYIHVIYYIFGVNCIYSACEMKENQLFRKVSVNIFWFHVHTICLVFKAITGLERLPVCDVKNNTSTSKSSFIALVRYSAWCQTINWIFTKNIKRILISVLLCCSNNKLIPLACQLTYEATNYKIWAFQQKFRSLLYKYFFLFWQCKANSTLGHELPLWDLSPLIFSWTVSSQQECPISPRSWEHF